MLEIWLIILAVCLGDAVLLWWCYPQLKRAWGIPFGANYVLLALLYFYAVFGYMCFFAGFNWESCWVCLTLLFSCLFLSALFWGLKKQCFTAAYVCVFLALFTVTAWFYTPHNKESISFMIALPVGVGFLLVYFLGNVVFPSSEEPQKEPDYLNRTAMYDRLVDEVRCLADCRIKAEENEKAKPEDAKREKNARGMNVALCSPWGSGKSHFLRYLCYCAARKSDKEEIEGWKEPFSVKHIDVWKASEEKELWKSVNEALVTAVLGEEKARLFYAEKIFVHSLLSVTADGSVAKNIYDLIYHKGDNFSVQRINERIAGKRVLLIFEDLERAKPEMLEALLPLIDRLRKINNLVSICSVDKEELEHRLGGDSVDRPQSYISKVFDRCLYLPAPEAKDVQEMQNHLLKARFSSSTLIPAIFRQFPHNFETPRKLIRAFESLESLERLHLWRLTQMQAFSFASFPGKTDLFPILLICEVEIIRACEPELLENIILKGGLGPFFKLCPADEMEDLLKEEEWNYANFLDSVPANITFYRASAATFLPAYPEMKKVIMDNGCVLAALSYLHRFRKLEGLEAYFVYAVNRGYEHDNNLISSLCELFGQECTASTPVQETPPEPTALPDAAGGASPDAGESRSVSYSEGSTHETSATDTDENAETDSPIAPGSANESPTVWDTGNRHPGIRRPRRSRPSELMDVPCSRGPRSAVPVVLDAGKFSLYMEDESASNFLQRQNQHYPMEIGYYSSCTSKEFVRLLLLRADAYEIRRSLSEQFFEKLTYLYQSMRMSQQASVLSPAFYLNRTRDKDGDTLDVRYQRWLRSSDENQRRLGKLCELFAQKLFCVAVNHEVFEREKENNIYDHHFHPYKHLQDPRLIAHFYAGFRQALSCVNYAPADMLLSFIYFLSTQYKSGDRNISVTSSFATLKMAEMMKCLYQLILGEQNMHNLTNQQKRKVVVSCDRTMSLLNQDLAAWYRMTYSPVKAREYIEGILQLNYLVRSIRDSYI